MILKIEPCYHFYFKSLIIPFIAYKCQRTKDRLLHEGVPDSVVTIIQVLHANDKLSYCATRLLKVLSVCPNNKARIVESGGIYILGNVIDMNLQSETPRRQTNTLHALYTLRNLSDEASKRSREINYQKIIEVLMKLIQRKQPNEQVKRGLSMNILYNLICRNYQNKGTTPTLRLRIIYEYLVLVIGNFNGIDILIKLIDHIISMKPKSDDKNSISDLESCISTLRILTKGQRIRYIQVLN